MPPEPQDVGPPDTGWFAFLLTFLGTALGPLACLALIALARPSLPNGKDAQIGLLCCGWPAAFPACFVVGAYCGNWLGKKLDRAVACLGKAPKRRGPG